MNINEKAEELFYTMIQIKNKLSEITKEMTRGEIGTLIYLIYKRDGATMVEISNELGYSMPRGVSIVKSLERKKYIKKVLDKEDKRKTLLFITNQGKRFFIEKRKEAIKKISCIIEKLDEKDIDEYIRLSNKINNIVTEMQE